MTPPPSPCPSTAPYGWGTGTQLAWWVTREQLRRPLITILATAVLITVIAITWPLGPATALWWGMGAAAVFYVAVGLVTVVVHLATLRSWARDGWLVGYFTPTASQLVHLENGVWVLSEHHAARRGRGYGAELRAVVWPHLVAEADRVGAAIGLATRSQLLAHRYQADMPGLEIAGQAGGTQFLTRILREEL